MVPRSAVYSLGTASCPTPRCHPERGARPTHPGVYTVRAERGIYCPAREDGTRGTVRSSVGGRVDPSTRRTNVPWAIQEPSRASLRMTQWWDAHDRERSTMHDKRTAICCIRLGNTSRPTHGGGTHATVNEPPCTTELSA